MGVSLWALFGVAAFYIFADLTDQKGQIQMTFMTINQTAKSEAIPAHALRTMLKNGQLPGFYSGTRYYVNVEQLRKQLSVPAVKP
jgi:hypothetical protein